MTRLSSKIALLWFTAIPLVAFGDCGDYAENFLASENCDLDENLSGWLVPFGFPSHEASEGVPRGSLRVDSEAILATKDAYIHAAVAGVCTSSVGGHLFSYGASIKEISGGVPKCLLRLGLFRDENCEDGFAGGYAVGAQFGDDLATWRTSTFRMLDNAPEEPRSAYVSVFCDSPTPFSVVIDNFYLTPGDGGAPLFFDGFEDGDLAHW